MNIGARKGKTRGLRVCLPVPHSFGEQVVLVHVRMTGRKLSSFRHSLLISFQRRRSVPLQGFPRVLWQHPNPKLRRGFTGICARTSSFPAPPSSKSSHCDEVPFSDPPPRKLPLVSCIGFERFLVPMQPFPLVPFLPKVSLCSPRQQHALTMIGSTKG